MKESTAAIIGVTAFGLGCAAVCAIRISKVHGMDRKLNDICKGIEGMTDNIDFTVPENIANVAIRNAADKAAQKAVSGVKDVAVDHVDSLVQATINETYKALEPELKKKLEDQINLASIEKIEQQVAGKVAERIFKSTPLVLGQSNSKEDLIKTCVANGMDAWDIRRILEASK